MDKTFKICIAFLVLLFVGIIYSDSLKPKPIDWTPTFNNNDKIPFGLYVFDKEMSVFFKNQKIEKITQSPYEYFLQNHDFKENLKNGTFINISEISEIDKQSSNQILQFVGAGNSAFISSKQLPISLLDILKIETKLDLIQNKSIYNWLANKQLSKPKYKIIEGVGSTYFSKINATNTTILGYQSGDSVRVNFIKVKFNKGTIFLHTQPAAFSNFHLLKQNNYQYTEKVLSYVPKATILWYINKQSGTTTGNASLSYIFSKPALKNAWLTFIFGMLIFMIFNAKRQQRIVPIIAPLPNTTIDFIKTIGNLYYQEGNHDNIINKKIIYFLEKIRSQYLIETNKLDDDFIKKMQQKTGKSLPDIQNVVLLINFHRHNPQTSTETDLIAINNAIEKII